MSFTCVPFPAMTRLWFSFPAFATANVCAPAGYDGCMWIEYSSRSTCASAVEAVAGRLVGSERCGGVIGFMLDEFSGTCRGSDVVVVVRGGVACE